MVDSRLTAALPIDEVLPALLQALASAASAVLQAPPGAGKTTRVPLALLDADWLGGERIIMLEPRRIAARAAARRMASTLDEPVGRRVGLRVRGESRVSTVTRVEVVTEGVLSRMLLDDPALDGVGLVVFDEFHERSVQADLGLALALQSQELVRPDLRLLVMSATLDGAAIASLLGNAPIITSGGRQHPVALEYVARRDDVRVEGAAAAVVRRALEEQEGSVLVFLPGVAEIRRTHALLANAWLPPGTRLLPLYGELAAEVQDEAIAPPRTGERKVVLATSIAETSLTIEGVGVVVDSGLARVPRFSPRSGMSRLETVRVSRASAEQRAGRAGRTAPGVCYRLWAEAEQGHLLLRTTPEILEADLVPLALDLAAAGITDVGTLRWLDTPPAAGMEHARELLVELGALNAAGRITPHGRQMSSFGMHPRLAHMLLAAHAFGAGATACVVAALLDERDVFRRDRDAARDVDLRTRVALFADGADTRAPDVDGERLRRVRELARGWRAQLGVVTSERVDVASTGRVLALAYPDRLAVRRGGSTRFLLRNGTGAEIGDAASLAGAEWLVIADLDGRQPLARVYLATALERSDVDSIVAADAQREDVVAWDADAGRVTSLRRTRLGAIVLREQPLVDVDETFVTGALLRALERGDGLALPWREPARRLRERLEFLYTLDPSWPDVRLPTLEETMAEWLASHLVGVRRRSEVEALDLGSVLVERLSWERRRLLEELAPTHVVVPTGSRLPIDYADPQSPVLAVRLQELFGLADTPRIGGGAVPLTLHLLSPAHRPVQVTRDLAGFWRSSYFDVRKELRGRYPRHSWPEDPLSAPPTRQAKPRT